MKHLNSFRLLLLVCFTFISAGNYCFSQSVGINSTGGTPHRAAGLDIDFLSGCYEKTYLAEYVEPSSILRTQPNPVI